MKYPEKVSKHIVGWVNEYLIKSKMQGLVVGVSGGIDSALTSTLCGLSGIKTLCLNMPIKQKEDQYLRAERHIQWLKKKSLRSIKTKYKINIGTHRDIQNEVDKILDKINSQGFGALSEEEKKILDRAKDILKR